MESEECSNFVSIAYLAYFHVCTCLHHSTCKYIGLYVPYAWVQTFEVCRSLCEGWEFLENAVRLWEMYTRYSEIPQIIWHSKLYGGSSNY